MAGINTFPLEYINTSVEVWAAWESLVDETEEEEDSIMTSTPTVSMGESGELMVTGTLENGAAIAMRVHNDYWKPKYHA